MCFVWPQEVEVGPRVKSISVQRKELSTDGKDGFSNLELYDPKIIINERLSIAFSTEYKQKFPLFP